MIVTGAFLNVPHMHVVTAVDKCLSLSGTCTSVIEK